MITTYCTIVRLLDGDRVLPKRPSDKQYPHGNDHISPTKGALLSRWFSGFPKAGYVLSFPGGYTNQTNLPPGWSSQAGLWIQPIWKNMLVTLDPFPNFRGKNKKYIWNHHLDFDEVYQFILEGYPI